MHNNYSNTYRYLFVSTMLLFVVSCSLYPADMNWALKLAGNNRVELERVLEYYYARHVS